MTLSELQQWVCEQVAADAWLAARSVTAVAECKADAAAEIEKSHAMYGIAALVLTPTFAATAQEENQVYGTATVAVQVAEIPAANRVRDSFATALAAAEHIGMLGSTWSGGRFARLSLLNLEGDLADGAVAYQVEIEMAICIELGTSEQ